MKNSATFSLDKLTTYREDSRLEVKSAKGGLPATLWESYSAFANSDGGVIVLGVKENKDGTFLVDGLPDVHRIMKDFWNAINNRQKVSSNILTDSMVYPYTLDGKDVIVIHVPRAERTSRPVYVGSDPRNGTFRRNGEGDYHCSREEVALMIRDSALVTDDNQLVTDFDDNIFCQDTVRAYRNIFRLVRPQHLWNHDRQETGAAMFLTSSLRSYLNCRPTLRSPLCLEEMSGMRTRLFTKRFAKLALICSLTRISMDGEA